MRRSAVVAATTLLLLALAAPVWACAGLIGRNGSVNLLRTTTLAAYYNGVEHYVTSFTFAGGGGEFGSIVPLPGVPSQVERGGDWTLQRLVRETRPIPEAFALRAAGAYADAKVLLETRIDALDITILEGGGNAVGQWAKEHGFLLSPDAPEVLDFYARRSQIFMAARFDAEAAKTRGQEVGDGTPIHLTIPTENPWVPLRILALGKGASEPIGADVYLLTPHRPALLPDPGKGLGEGLVLQASRPASDRLMFDLRSDKGMEWMPESGMWLTHLTVEARAGDLTYDLAIDADGNDRPSPVAAGLKIPGVGVVPGRGVATLLPASFGLLLVIGGAVVIKAIFSA